MLVCGVERSGGGQVDAAREGVCWVVGLHASQVVKVVVYTTQ
jgi:hypothetical protein